MTSKNTDQALIYSCFFCWVYHVLSHSTWVQYSYILPLLLHALLAPSSVQSLQAGRLHLIPHPNGCCQQRAGQRPGVGGETETQVPLRPSAPVRGGARTDGVLHYLLPGASVCLFVCLFVCLVAGWQESRCMNSHISSQRDWTRARAAQGRCFHFLQHSQMDLFQLLQFPSIQFQVEPVW